MSQRAVIQIANHQRRIAIDTMTSRFWVSSPLRQRPVASSRSYFVSAVILLCGARWCLLLIARDGSTHSPTRQAVSQSRSGDGQGALPPGADAPSPVVFLVRRRSGTSPGSGFRS